MLKRSGDLFFYRNWISFFVDRNVDDPRLGHANDLFMVRSPLRLYIYMYGDRRFTDLFQFGVERDNVSDMDRLFEFDLGHGDCNEAVIGKLSCFVGSRKVNMGKNDSSEDGSPFVRIPGKKDDPYGRISCIHPEIIPAFRSRFKRVDL